MIEHITKLVRPVITISFAGCAIYLAVMGKVSPDFVMGITSSLIAFWFGVSAGAKLPEQLPQEHKD